jgi:hypothetical protein
VYGQLYPQLWLENQLKSLCDETNLPSLRDRYDVEYAIFTDEETLAGLTRHPNFTVLSQHCRISVIRLTWPPDVDRFSSRYNVLVQMFQQALNHALQENALLSVWVADLVFAKHALPRMLAHLERGHDAVFNVPLRGSADSANPILASIKGAPTDLELYEIAMRNLHHLWVASLWDSPLFSKFPYSMLWRTDTGLVAHSFGITPIVFKPSEALRAVRGVIDADVPSFFTNPYWATDWTDAPVAGIEPLSNGHYPPFQVHRASVEGVVQWAKVGTVPVQTDNLDKPLFYPSRKQFNDEALAQRAADTARQIQSTIRSGLSV